MDNNKLQMEVFSEFYEFLMCMHDAIGYFDTVSVTVLDHPTHACIAIYVVCLTMHVVELTYNCA